MTHTDAQRHKRIAEHCKESKVFKQVFAAMMRDELSYCSCTGKILSVIAIKELDDGTHIDIKKPIY